jgi:hypothetical protein
MSRYTLSATKFAELVLGWDRPTGGFFLQCFASSESDDEEPAVWLPKLAMTELERELFEVGVTMPDLLRRTLLAEMQGRPLRLVAGDPVLWRGSSGRVSTPCTLIEPLLTFAQVRWCNGEEQTCLMAELEPDLASLDVR